VLTLSGVAFLFTGDGIDMRNDPARQFVVALPEHGQDLEAE
jgi:hypothetical protein